MRQGHLHLIRAVPQIWLDGTYVGGADQLSELLKRQIEPNPDRGQCSLSPTRRAA